MSKKRPLSLIIQPEAETDLREIGDYIAQNNRVAAQEFVARLYEKCTLLTHYPNMGQERADMRKGLQHFPVGRYLILYRVTADRLEIVRVLHSARFSKP